MYITQNFDFPWECLCFFCNGPVKERFVELYFGRFKNNMEVWNYFELINLKFVCNCILLYSKFVFFNVRDNGTACCGVFLF